MIDKYRVLLPKWVFIQAENKEEQLKYILNYLERYPHYSFLYEENGFAICNRIRLKKDGENG